MSISRRDILKSLTMTAVTGSVLRVIPLKAAEYAHHMVKTEKAAQSGAYTPKFFSPSAYKTLQSLCQTIIPPDENAKTDPSLGQGIEFFSFLRKMTADGFFTSEIGINYLGYIGNTYMSEFPGCPPVPGE